MVEVMVEVLLYQPARGQGWSAELTFDASDPDSQRVSYHMAVMEGDEERRPCFDADEHHRFMKTN